MTPEEILRQMRELLAKNKEERAQKENAIATRQAEIEDSIKEREAQLNELQTKLESAMESREAQGKEVEELRQKVEMLERRQANVSAEQKVSHRELIRRSIEGEETRSFVPNPTGEGEMQDRFAEDVKRFRQQGGQINTGIKMNVRDITFTQPANTYVGEVLKVGPEIKPLTSLFENIIPIIDAGSDTEAIAIMKHTGTTGTAEMVAKNGLKPLVDFTMETEYKSMKKVAVGTKVADETLKYAPRMRSIIDQLLEIEMVREKNNQIAAGDGTGNNRDGFIPNATPITFAAPFAGRYDKPTFVHPIRAAIAALRKSYLVPDVIIMGTDTAALFDLEQDADGNLMFPKFMDEEGQTISRVPVYEHPALDTSASGTIIVADVQRAVRIYRGSTLSINVFNQNEDDARHNRILIQAEQYMLVANVAPWATVKFQLDTAITQLTKPAA